MKDGRATAKYFQLQLPSDNTRKQHNAAHVTRPFKSRTNSKNIQSPTRSQSSHDCVTIDYESPSLNAQHILVGSALRRPHATQFSPLDSQTMPDVGRSPRQPYKSQSSCTVFTYAARPVSARSEPTHFGRHTKSSLLRCKSASAVSSSASTSSISSCGEDHSKSHICNKKLCKIREDYRFFNTGSYPKQNPPHGESMHAFLTGARYNRTRFLDSRSLSRLGVYIPKADLNTFFIKEDKAGQYSDDDDASISNEDSPEGSSSELDQECDALTQNKAINTEPYFLSISRWQPAEWKTNRKNTREPRVTSAPVRIKPFRAYYYDYDNVKRKRPSTTVQKEKIRH